MNFLATYNIRSPTRNSEKKIVLCSKGDDITRFDGIMTIMSGWMVHQYSVFFNSENEALRNAILQACGLIKEEIVPSAQVNPISLLQETMSRDFFVEIFSKFIELE